MRRPVLLAVAVSLVLPAAAAAQQPVSPAPTPTPPPTTPVPPPAPEPAPKPKPVDGKLKLRITPGPVIEGSRIGVRGRLAPRIAGQRVLVRIYRDGHRVHESSERPDRHGRFMVHYHSPSAGRIRAVAIHRHTKALRRVTAKSRAMTVIPASASYGSRGPSVQWLQRHLARAQYAVSRSGVFDDATARAVLAYRKMTGLSRTSEADRTVFRGLAEGKGRFPVRYRSHGRHVEGDLTHQVLALIDTGGKVRRLYPMSSGKPSTPTVLGHYEVYLKTPGTNSEGMVDSNYFIRGYAIHGYYQVPTYAASHGCLRIPIPNAAEVYAWVHIGTPVDVYYR